MEEPRLVGGRYELGEMLGLGGMAEVRVGRDRRLGRNVAIKIMRTDLVSSSMFTERFRREALAAAALDHPAIVAVYDAGEDEVDGTVLPYIVMEYVEGQTLRDLRYGSEQEARGAADHQHERAEPVAATDEAWAAETIGTETVEADAVSDKGADEGADGPDAEEITPARALEITARVLAALEFSHRAGVVHRDIKPANVMLASSGEVKVMDFGIARMLDAAATMTGTSTVIGTAHYLSPEQARGDAVDGRSDVYSTGCLLYELLTHRPPFLGDSPVAVAYQHVRQEPHPPSVFVPNLPPAVEAITLKALAKNLEDRYSTAAEMAADIHRALAGQEVRGHPAVASTAKHAGDGESGQTGTLPAVGEAATSDEQQPSLRRRAAPVLAVLAMALVVGFGAFGLTGLLGSADDEGGEAEPRRSDVQDSPSQREPMSDAEEDASSPAEDRAEPVGEVNEPTSDTDEGAPEPTPNEETPQQESTPTPEEPTEESPESTSPPSDPPGESEPPEDSETPTDPPDDPTDDDTGEPEPPDDPPTTDPEGSGDDPPPDESSDTPGVRAEFGQL